ncbi:MAG TPA: hypothetical protein VGA19_10040 [Rhodospirillales bacterium]
MLLVASMALVALAISSGVGTAHAEGTPERICGSHEAVVKTLNGKYAEKPVSMGLANNGTVVEVLSSEDGSWTIVMTTPNGVSCLLAAGDYWQSLPEKVAGRTL